MATDEDALITCDHPDDTEWCSIPECVRPVTFHPHRMHLTEDGREFETPRPTLRVVS